MKLILVYNLTQILSYSRSELRYSCWVRVNDICGRCFSINHSPTDISYDLFQWREWAFYSELSQDDLLSESCLQPLGWEPYVRGKPLLSTHIHCTGENPDITLDDWLLSLMRAATQNAWSGNELLLQLAGHRHGRALQEWNLMEEAEKAW